VGYNWLQSNEQSARYLRQRIDEILTQWPKPHQCDKVLIVTHSMGGLVARRCSQLIPDKILAVMHGVMPTLGAAAAYKRMRAGFEGAAAVVLGWNEAEATASIANAPGPLELLPQPAYNDRKPWLQLQARDAGRGGVYATQWLPAKDAYTEIYEKDANTCWYGLVNSELIDPAGIHIAAQLTPWNAYKINLKLAREFHKALSDHYHFPTRAFYGADRDYNTWGNACWHTPDLSRDAMHDMTQGVDPTSDGLGTINLTLSGARVKFKLSRPDTIGDGTVPAEASGQAPAHSPNVQQCYRMIGFDHQFSYNSREVRLMLLHSLARLVLPSQLFIDVPYKT
jgi:pimeloyl-ACP methyl ester carboxylesterase